MSPAAKNSLRKGFIIGLRYGFTPFRTRIGPVDFNGQMLEGTVLGGTVPMLDVGRDVDDVAGMERLGRFPPFLIPAAAGRD